MKTVDALIAARDLIADGTHWVRSRLVSRKFISDDPACERVVDCYCAMGATMKVTGCIKDGAVVPGLAVSIIDGPRLPKSKEREAELLSAGADVRTAANAVRYLEAAGNQLMGFKDKHGGTVVTVNDSYGHLKTLEMFDLAIKNAKRRHINGGRTAVKAVSK